MDLSLLRDSEGLLDQLPGPGRLALLEGDVPQLLGGEPPGCDPADPAVGLEGERDRFLVELRGDVVEPHALVGPGQPGQAPRHEELGRHVARPGDLERSVPEGDRDLERPVRVLDRIPDLSHLVEEPGAGEPGAPDQERVARGLGQGHGGLVALAGTVDVSRLEHLPRGLAELLGAGERRFLRGRGGGGGESQAEDGDEEDREGSAHSPILRRPGQVGSSSASRRSRIHRKSGQAQAKATPQVTRT